MYLAVYGGRGSDAWSVSAGSLRPGMGLSASGDLGGTPRAAGTYSFTVQVRDAAGDTVAQPLTLTVNAAPAAGPSIASFSAGSGGPGTVVSFTGTDLSQVRVVEFAARAGTDLRASGDGTTLTVVAPSGAGTVTVTVVTLSKRIAAGTFTYS